MNNNYSSTTTTKKSKKKTKESSKKKHKKSSSKSKDHDNIEKEEEGEIKGEWHARQMRKNEKTTISGHSKKALKAVYPVNEFASAEAGIIVPSFIGGGKREEVSGLDGIMFDRKGDSENRRYGSAVGSKKGTVPRYYSVGNRILGSSDPHYRIARTARVGANALVVYKVGGQKERLTDRDYRTAYRTRPVQFRKLMDLNAKADASMKGVTGDEDKKNLLEDFIAFPKTKKVLDVVKYDSINNDGEGDDGNSKNAMGIDEDEDSFPSADSSTQHRNLQESPEFIESTRRLNLRLENNPKNLSTWQELLQLQDTLLPTMSTSTTAAQQSKTAKLVKAITEKKLSIYEKALKHFPTATQLLLPYLTLCEQEFGDSEPARVLTLWDKVLKRVGGGDLEVWDRYLTFRQTSYLSFSVNGWVDAVEGCLEVLRGLDDSEKTQSSLLHIFTRLCNLLHESGYTERAIALYQGLIEFSIFTPPAFMEMEWRQRVDIFEDFWESECARVGEAGWNGGWKDNIVGAEGVVGYSVYKGDDDAEDGDEDEYKQWFRKEMEFSYMNWAPQRSTTAKGQDEAEDGEEEEDVDPFGTIIFDDIKPFLFNLTSPTLKSRLISNFLNLLSCQFNMTSTSTPALVASDSLMRIELMNNTLVSQFFPKPDSTESAVFPAFPLKTFPLTHSTLFSTSPNSPSLLSSNHVTSIQESGNMKLEFVQNLVRQTWKVLEEWDDIGIPFLLGLEAATTPSSGSGKNGGVKSALKLAKSLLKEERMNLSIWAFYTRLEVERGKFDEARKIYQTAISSYRTFPLEYQHDAVLLHLAYAEMETECLQFSHALWVLVSFTDPSVDILAVENEKPTATRILKARKFLNEMTDSAILKCNTEYQQTLQQPSSQAIRITSALVACTSLFEYLHSNNSLDEPFQYLSQTISKAGLLPALRELILETKLKLHISHSKKPGFFVRPGDMREAMEQAVSEFPHDTVFLARFVEHEAKTKIENRVRRLFDVELKK
ncbi:UNVERIFIED_CONTAM: hypothetical protein HDU68_011538 [Siphonaria sp. JEL0065]|nr:hypothetical protein HDU68_011538 [Siphonaria sp. JEL0065]